MLQNKVWLSQVLSGLALSDPVKDMMQNLKVAAEPAETDDDLERQESALENLQEFCENIDLAKGERASSYNIIRLEAGGRANVLFCHISSSAPNENIS